MSAQLILHRAGPAMTLQDLGRPGHIAQGIGTGGAADRLALLEAAALLQAAKPLPVIEMAGLGGSFEVTQTCRFALTGAPMRATLNGSQIAWNESHLISPGDRLDIGGASEGVYGYLCFAGEIATPPWLDSRATQADLGIGRRLEAGDNLPLGPDPDPQSPLRRLSVEGRCNGGSLRMMPGPQTELFSTETLQRALATPFRRGPAANRQGVRLDQDGAPFGAEKSAVLASDFITIGDIQMTGDGVPYILLADCQTMGGYPRLGTVLPCDLPKLAQAPLGAEIRLILLSLAEADGLWKSDQVQLAELRRAAEVKIRDPLSIRDLLRYQLISGVTAGDDLERDRD